MEKGLKNYTESIKSDVAALVYSDGDGASFEDKFTEHCLEILDNAGKSEGAFVVGRGDVARGIFCGQYAIYLSFGCGGAAAVGHDLLARGFARFAGGTQFRRK